MCCYATLEKLCNVQEDILILNIYNNMLCVVVLAYEFILQAVDNLDYVIDTCDTSLRRVRDENCIEIHREWSRRNKNNHQFRFIIVTLLFHSSLLSAFLLPAHQTVYGFGHCNFIIGIIYYITYFIFAEVCSHHWRYLTI